MKKRNRGQRMRKNTISDGRASCWNNHYGVRTENIKHMPKQNLLATAGTGSVTIEIMTSAKFMICVSVVKWFVHCFSPIQFIFGSKTVAFDNVSYIS